MTVECNHARNCFGFGCRWLSHWLINGMQGIGVVLTSKSCWLVKPNVLLAYVTPFSFQSN